MIYSQLKKVLNYRIGIEFELAGEFVDKFYQKYYPNVHKDRKSVSGDAANQLIINKYHLKDFRADHYTFKNIEREDPSITEIRISIDDFHGLQGLYDFLQDVNEFCIIHPNGGIHFHLDLSRYFSSNDWKECNRYVRACMNWCSKRLDRLETILPKYTGTYNKKKVAFKSKASWINFSRLTTMEVRIAPLTFEYATLISWIAGLSKFRNEMLNQCGLSKSRRSATKVNKVVSQLTTSGNYLTAGYIEEINLNSQAVTLSQYERAVDQLHRRIDDLTLQIDDLSNNTTYRIRSNGTEYAYTSGSAWNTWS